MKLKQAQAYIQYSLGWMGIGWPIGNCLLAISSASYLCGVVVHMYVYFSDLDT